jgi:L-threonylcarbamoyladenylate synthase
VRRGGVIAYPTEAVYGLGCDPRDERAVRRILALKSRPPEKGLILIAADPEQLDPFVLPLDETLRARVLATWPGPFTWLLPARPDTPDWLRGAHDTLACRVTAHPVARRLCELAGTALVSTSANPAGLPPARSAAETARYFPEGLDAIVEGPVDRDASPSEIRDARSGRVLRPG